MNTMPAFRGRNYSPERFSTLQRLHSQQIAGESRPTVLRAHLYGTVCRHSKPRADWHQRGGVFALHSAAWVVARAENKRTLRVLSHQLGLSTLQGGYCYGKNDKVLERLMSPQRPPSLLRVPLLAVGEGHKLCWLGPDQTKATCLLRLSSQASRSTEDHWPL
jgi:hypothetical protein